METDIDELPLFESEVADTYKLVVTSILDDGYEVTQSFMNRAEIAGTGEGTSSVGVRRVRHDAATRVKFFNRGRTNSTAKGDEVHQRDDSTLGVCER